MALPRCTKLTDRARLVCSIDPAVKPPVDYKPTGRPIEFWPESQTGREPGEGATVFVVRPLDTRESAHFLRALALSAGAYIDAALSALVCIEDGEDKFEGDKLQEAVLSGLFERKVLARLGDHVLVDFSAGKSADPLPSGDGPTPQLTPTD